YAPQVLPVSEVADLAGVVSFPVVSVRRTCSGHPSWGCSGPTRQHESHPRLRLLLFFEGYLSILCWSRYSLSSCLNPAKRGIGELLAAGPAVVSPHRIVQEAIVSNRRLLGVDHRKRFPRRRHNPFGACEHLQVGGFHFHPVERTKNLTPRGVR